MGLTVDRIDFLRRTITVDRQLVQTPGKGMQFGPPKTLASVRTVPAPAEVIQRLARHVELYSIEHPWGLVFTNSRQREWSRSRFSDIWRTAAEDAKLPEGTRFHDLRHHTASLLIAAGCSARSSSINSAMRPPPRPWTPTATSGPMTSVFVTPSTTPT